jgi:bacteriocin biosynthesis cyclodehydratase domain-containing protein
LSPDGLPRLPLLTAWHRLVEEEDRVVLEYGGEAVCFEGRAARLLLPGLMPLLDGSRTVDEVVATVGEAARPAVEHALRLLAAHGLLVDGPPIDATTPEPFVAAALLHVAADAQRISPADARRALRKSMTVVVGTGSAAGEIVRTLRLSGAGDVLLGPASALGHEAPSLTVAAPAPTELSSLPAWNERMLAKGLPWLQVLPYNGAFSAIGPLFVPGQTCCYECYRRRRASNVDYPDEFWALERSTGGIGDAPAVASAVAGLASLIALRWLLWRDPSAAGVMTALELGDSLELHSHTVYRVPRCPACTDAGRCAAPLPWAEAS